MSLPLWVVISRKLILISVKSKVLYIISDIAYALVFEWLAKNHNRELFDLETVVIKSSPDVTDLEQMLAAHQIPVHAVVVGSTGRAKQWLQVLKLIRKIKPAAVHCHMRRANMLGITASWIAGVPKRIFTRHYSTYNHQHFPRSVFIDRLINQLATKIVAPSIVVKNTLIHLEKVPAKKVVLIHHGFDLDYLSNPDALTVAQLRQKYNLHSDQPVVGVISRLLELKGWDYIIPAFGAFLQTAPNAVLLMANASGPYEKQVNELLKQLPDKSFRVVRFEKELASLYACMNYFIHVPNDQDIEAFGQIYIEALACGVPAVFTLSGVANEFIEHHVNALVVSHQNTTEITNALIQLHTDEPLRSRLIKNGKQAVDSFNFGHFLQKTEQLYV